MLIYLSMILGQLIKMKCNLCGGNHNMSDHYGNDPYGSGLGADAEADYQFDPNEGVYQDDPQAGVYQNQATPMEAPTNIGRNQRKR